MMIPAQTLRKIQPIQPFCERTRHNGLTYGLGPAGYDVRIAEGITASAGQFLLASTVEHFNIPNDILGKVCDKSSWARRGIAVQNTVIEPGWRGFLTLELTNHGLDRIVIEAGDPIAQIIFFRLEAATEMPYAGKYQDQEAGPQPARLAANSILQSRRELLGSGNDSHDEEILDAIHQQQLAANDPGEPD